eukprot:TRINITY_DN17754_c0_g1_i1.p1 TRINITY_DN17754_c0_g1~~TRINITY_DN17754_c0_g1_i1.p1  ORF type:complete len:414 (+),score=3.06 TRINITY_DN17754_c0_g1_i1:61-1302(+)
MPSLLSLPLEVLEVVASFLDRMWNKHFSHSCSHTLSLLQWRSVFITNTFPKFNPTMETQIKEIAVSLTGKQAGWRYCISSRLPPTLLKNLTRLELYGIRRVVPLHKIPPNLVSFVLHATNCDIRELVSALDSAPMLETLHLEMRGNPTRPNPNFVHIGTMHRQLTDLSFTVQSEYYHETWIPLETHQHFCGMDFPKLQRLHIEAPDGWWAPIKSPILLPTTLVALTLKGWHCRKKSSSEGEPIAFCGAGLQSLARLEFSASMASTCGPLPFYLLPTVRTMKLIIPIQRSELFAASTAICEIGSKLEHLDLTVIHTGYFHRSNNYQPVDLLPLGSLAKLVKLHISLDSWDHDMCSLEKLLDGFEQLTQYALMLNAGTSVSKQAQTHRFVSPMGNECDWAQQQCRWDFTVLRTSW